MGTGASLLDRTGDFRSSDPRSPLYANPKYATDCAVLHCVAPKFTHKHEAI